MLQFFMISYQVHALKIYLNVVTVFKYQISNNQHVNIIMIYNWDKRNGGHLEHVQ